MNDRSRSPSLDSDTQHARVAKRKRSRESSSSSSTSSSSSSGSSSRSRSRSRNARRRRYSRSSSRSSSRRRYRGRSRSRRRQPMNEGNSSNGGSAWGMRQELRSMMNRPLPPSAASAKQPIRPYPETSAVDVLPSPFKDRNCVRIGIVRPEKPLTVQQLYDEMDAIKFTSHVVRVAIEEDYTLLSQGQDSQLSSSDGSSQQPLTVAAASRKIHWGRIYLSTAEEADLCAAELRSPLHVSKWRQFITQRLPLQQNNDPMFTVNPALGSFFISPPDGFVVEGTTGMPVYLSTGDVHSTRGVVMFYADAEEGAAPVERTRLSLCAAFDPEEEGPSHATCPDGVNCSHVHLKRTALSCLLQPPCIGDFMRPVPTAWERRRFRDTLVYRPNEEQTMTFESLQYMFGQCKGFHSVHIRVSKDFKRFGFVRFHSSQDALHALQQTSNANVQLSLYGALVQWRETLHRLQSAVLPADAATSAAVSVVPAHAFRGATGHSDEIATSPGAPPAQQGDGGLPFPSLPEGWEHGFSRRTRQYYFFQPKTKNSTTWKHPVTSERYGC